jgi:hypothetical protein
MLREISLVIVTVALLFAVESATLVAAMVTLEAVGRSFGAI